MEEFSKKLKSNEAFQLSRVYRHNLQPLFLFSFSKCFKLGQSECLKLIFLYYGNISWLTLGGSSCKWILGGKKGKTLGKLFGKIIQKVTKVLDCHFCKLLKYDLCKFFVKHRGFFFVNVWKNWPL